MSPRLIVLIVAGLVAMSCSSQPVHRQVRAHDDDGLFWGRMDTLSAANRQIILSTARQRLATLAPSSRIRSIKIFSESEVRVFFASKSSSPPGEIGMERIAGKWRITDEHQP